MSPHRLHSLYGHNIFYVMTAAFYSSSVPFSHLFTSLYSLSTMSLFFYSWHFLYIYADILAISEYSWNFTRRQFESLCFFVAAHTMFEYDINQRPEERINIKHFSTFFISFSLCLSSMGVIFIFNILVMNFSARSISFGWNSHFFFRSLLKVGWNEWMLRIHMEFSFFYTNSKAMAANSHSCFNVAIYSIEKTNWQCWK